MGHASKFAVPAIAPSASFAQRANVENLMKKIKHSAGWGRATFGLMALICTALWITGLVMFAWPAESLMDLDPTEGALRHAAGVVHGVSTWLFCLMCGRGVWPHVRVMWLKRNAKSNWLLGVIHLFVLSVISLGGLVLLYGSPEWHDGMSPVHFWVGVFSPIVFFAHTWRRLLPFFGVVNR
jgi:hypothetical protein